MFIILESNARPTETNQEISRLAREGLEYLDTRTEFWQQQKPMYSRKRDKNMRDSARGSGKQNAGAHAVRELEKIEYGNGINYYKNKILGIYIYK